MTESRSCPSRLCSTIHMHTQTLHRAASGPLHHHKLVILVGHCYTSMCLGFFPALLPPQSNILISGYQMHLFACSRLLKLWTTADGFKILVFLHFRGHAHSFQSPEHVFSLALTQIQVFLCSQIFAKVNPILFWSLIPSAPFPLYKTKQPCHRNYCIHSCLKLTSLALLLIRKLIQYRHFRLRVAASESWGCHLVWKQWTMILGAPQAQPLCGQLRSSCIVV